MNLKQIRSKIDGYKGQRDQVQKDIDAAKKNCDAFEKDIRISEKAQAIIQTVAAKTQEELEYRITEPVSLAFAAVYQDPYKLSAKFNFTGKGNTECHLGFERNGSIIKPLESAGGGMIDIASFALRVGCWSLAMPRSRPLLITDEPFKWVDKRKVGDSDLTTMHLAGQMLKDVSKPAPEGLGLQVIMISHIDELIECADRTIEAKIKKSGETILEVR